MGAAAPGMSASPPPVKGGSFLELARDGPRELWMIFAMKALWGLAEFSLTAVLVLFLSDDLGMDDVSAGWVFGLVGLCKAVYGCVCGFAVDILGVRWSLLGGSFLLTLGLVVVASSQNSMIAVGALLTVKAFGSALLLNPMMFAIRRYTTSSSRPFAFSLFYVIMNCSAFAAQLLVNVMRNNRGYAPDGITLWRLMLWVSVFSGGITFLLALLFRDPPANRAAGPEEEGAPLQPGPQAPRPSTWELTKATLGEPKFFRLAALCLVFVGVRLIFVHMNATFPKFFTRVEGREAPFELILALNPFCIMTLVPCFTYLIVQFGASTPLVLTSGAILTGISPLPLVYDTSYATAIAFVVLLSLGEALWSPKLYEHSVAVSPVGREGTYGALSTAPLFASMMFAGGFSGHLLQEHCPRQGDCNGRPLWLLVMLTTLTSPLVLLLFNTCLFVKADVVVTKEDTQAESQAAQGYGAADAAGPASSRA